jgi:hypothetical protein
MKALIVVLMALAYQFSFAHGENPTAPALETEKGEKDWNQIFKQPVTNGALAQPPAATQIIEPAFMSEVKGSEITLKWKPVEGAKYHLQVAKDPMYKWLVVNEPLVTYTEYSLKQLQPKTQYFWRVYTQKPDNNRGYTKGFPAGSEFEVK